MAKICKFLSAIAVLIAILSGASQVRGQEESTRLLQLQGFRVSARVRIIRANSVKVDREFFVSEYYSNIEKRSRLDIQLIDRTQTDASLKAQLVQYYYEAANKQLVRLTNRRFDECLVVTGEKYLLTDELFGAMSSVDKHLTANEWFIDRTDAPDYIIGLARLLVIVDENKSKMRQTSDQNTASIRNRQSVRFLLQDPLGSSSGEEKSRLAIYYGKSDNGVDETPLRIWFIHSTGAEIIVDYSRFNQINFDVIAANDYYNIYNSFLMIPLHGGCSNFLAKSDLLQGRPAPKLISFRMRIDDYNDDSPARKYFVAYDGFLNALRRDEIDKTRASARSTTVYDYEAKRKYNIRYEKNSWPSGGGESNYIDTRESQCAVALIEDDERAQLELLLPFKELVAMGHAMMRGIDTVVFEQTSLTLPEIFFVKQAANFMNASGKSETKYSIVYYFASPSEADEIKAGSILQIAGHTLGPLIRVKISKKGWTSYVIDLEEFQWQLADAPNGDRSSELFSLREDCYGENLRPSSFATVKLALSLDGGETIGVDEAFKALSNPIVRNTGLTRALSKASLTPTQIYDLESRIDKQANSIKIQTSAKLNIQNQIIHEAIYVGPGTWGASALMTNAETADECLWDAVHLRKSGEILFTFCFKYCRIDLDVEITYEANKTVKGIKSKGIQLGATMSSCKVYRLKPTSTDDQTGLATKKSFDNSKSKLRTSPLKLPVPAGDKFYEIPMSVKLIKIGNDRWLETSLNADQIDGKAGDPDALGEAALKGIGLVVGSGTTTRVQPKQVAEDAADGDDFGSASMMSYALCHSICVAKITCHSFSLCSTSGQLECLISETEFRDPRLLASIVQQASLSGYSSKKATISVQAQPAPSETEDVEAEADTSKSTGSGGSIELRVDRRCHLYNKRALELFHPPERIGLSLRKKSLIAVDSAEECADACLRSNARYFRRATRRRKQTISMGREEGFVAKLRALEGKNLRLWCKSFAYNTMDELDPEQFRDIINQSESGKRGLCYLYRSQNTSHKSSPKDPANGERTSKDIGLNLYHFDFVYTSLFEPQYGRKLNPTKQAHKLDLDKLTMDEMRRFIRDDNTQVAMRVTDVEVCARMCFLESVDLDPWCQSFGRFEELVKNNKSSIAEVQSYCIFNTNTMVAALRSQMAGQLVSTVPKNMTFVHYEPRNLLNLESVILDQLSPEEIQLSRSESRNWSVMKYTQTGVLILLALALATGLALVQFIVAYLVGPSQQDSATGSMGPHGGAFLAKISNIFNRTNQNELDLGRLVRNDDDADDIAAMH